MFKSISDYFKGSWQELAKVSWPDRARTVRLSIFVLISILIGLALVAAIDYGLTALIDLILKRV